MRWGLGLCTLFLLITAAAPARAELVFFQSGRAMSVRAVRSEGDELVLQLRSGGDIHCDKSVIVKVQPDEVEYPEEVLAALPLSRTILEPAAIPGQYRDLIRTASATHGEVAILAGNGGRLQDRPRQRQ